MCIRRHVQYNILGCYRGCNCWLWAPIPPLSPLCNSLTQTVFECARQTQLIAQVESGCLSVSFMGTACGALCRRTASGCDSVVPLMSSYQAGQPACLWTCYTSHTMELPTSSAALVNTGPGHKATPVPTTTWVSVCRSCDRGCGWTLTDKQLFLCQL
jgi:hypothetical protein